MPPRARSTGHAGDGGRMPSRPELAGPRLERSRSWNSSYSATADATSPCASRPSMRARRALSRLGALKAALLGERRGLEFYHSVAGFSKDPEIVKQAKEFVKEEAEHVEILERWIAREESLQKSANS